MKKKKRILPVNRNILLALAITGFILWLCTFYFKESNERFAESYSDLIVSIAIILQFIPWLIVLIDLMRVHIRNKFMWYICMFTISPITSIIYLMTREKHIRLYKRFKAVES